MCVVSMIGDHFRDKWTNPGGYGAAVTAISPSMPNVMIRPITPVGRDEFEALKREVEEMKALLRRAKAYDERNGEPDCEIDEKMDVLRKVAKLVGIDLNDVIGPPKTIGL